MASRQTEITLDHVTPRHLGWLNYGTFDTSQNVVACCKDCNRDKGGRMPTEDELERLAALNETYSDAIADKHYQDMLRLSVHSLKLLELNRIG